MNPDRFYRHDDEERELVLSFERTVLQGDEQFFDEDELEVIIDYYFDVSDMQPLEQAMNYAEKLYPDSTSVRLRRAMWHIVNGNHQEAWDTLVELRTREPNNTDIDYTIGVLYSEMGDHHKAIEHFLKSTDDAWDLGLIYSCIAEEYVHLGNSDEAIRFFHLALDTDNYSTSTLYNYTDALLGTPHIDEGIAYLQSFVGEHPYCAEAWHCLGILQSNLGLHEKAEDAFEYAIAIDKYLDGAYTDLAISQEYAGRTADAISTFLRHSKVADNPSKDYAFVGRLHLSHNNVAAAYDYLQKAVQHDPESALAHASLALCYAQMGDHSEASFCIRLALRLDDSTSEILFLAAQLYDYMGNKDAARDYYERMMGASFVSEEMVRCYVDFLFGSRDFDGVIEQCEHDFSVYPNDPFTATYLAAAYFCTNRYRRLHQVLPYVDTTLLLQLCPEIERHPLLAQFLPPVQSVKE